MHDQADTLAWTQMQRETLGRLFRRHLRGEVRFDKSSRVLYSTDASLYRIEPLGVVIPKDQEDLQSVIAIAMQQRVPLIPRGGGTSLSGQSVGAGLIVDVSKYLNRIGETNFEEQWVEVEPGVVLAQLNRHLAPHGFQFGPDVATIDRANLGGMIGNNSAGARSIIYGKTIDHVLSLDLLLTDGSRACVSGLNSKSVDHLSERKNLLGQIYRVVRSLVTDNHEEIIARYPKLLRRVSGYNLDALLAPAPMDLSKLIVGSEGTLATVAKARLKIVPLPKERGVAAVHFRTLHESLVATQRIFASMPSAIELLDGMIIRLARQNSGFRHRVDFVRGMPEAILIVEYSAESVAELDSKFAQLKKDLSGSDGLGDIIMSHEPQFRDHIWNVRKTALPLLQTLPGTRKPITFVEDTAVDPKRLPEFVARFREILHDHGTDGSFYGHASVGCLHIRPLIDIHAPQGKSMMTDIAHRVCDLVMEFGGALSGEHGDGLARSMFNEKLFGKKIYQAFRDLKGAFDPHGLMNPGKIVDGPHLTENLRPPLDTSRVPEVSLHYAEALGPLEVVGRCNGNALCRHQDTQNMCPSYMATLEEQHSPRGRANLLRAALEGELDSTSSPSWAHKELGESLDLCLMCKACKTECPSSVDISKLKTEYLHRRHKEGKSSLLERLVADTPNMAKMGSRFAPFSNWALRSLPVRWLMHGFLGIDYRRRLPRYHRRTLKSWFRQHDAACTRARGKVVLLADCFTNYHEPRLGRHAVTLLEWAGYQVYLAPICCGRTLISKGFLDDARAMVAGNIDRLIPFAEDNVPILGIEPSCLLAIADEWNDLVPGEDSQIVSRQALLLDSWLGEQAANGRTDLPGPPTEVMDVTYHGHCHQKAANRLSGSVKALQNLGNTRTNLLDSGCCGMAGSFGYEARHYDVSVQIANQRLIPVVQANRESTVVAPGFSCRSQLADLANTTALHPVELLYQRLEPMVAARNNVAGTVMK